MFLQKPKLLDRMKHLLLGLILLLTACNGEGSHLVGEYKSNDDNDVVTIAYGGGNIYTYHYIGRGDGIGPFEGQKNVIRAEWELIGRYDKDCTCLKMNSPTGPREALVLNDGRIIVTGKDGRFQGTKQ